jgi:hypothetical protein
MKFNKFYILGLIPLFFVITIYISLNSSHEEKSETYPPYTFSSEIGDPANFLLVNLSTLPSDKHPFSFSFDEKKTVSALVLDVEDRKKFCDLYYNQSAYIIPDREYRRKSNLFDEDGKSKVKYLIQLSVRTDMVKNKPHLMNGYITYDGVFLQYVEDPSNKSTYIKGRFNKNDMKIIDSIYEKWYTAKLNGYN